MDALAARTSPSSQTSLGPTELLALWEQAAGEMPGARAVRILAHAGADEPGDLTLGERDKALLACFERWFGAELDAVASCPSCGAVLEASIPVRDLRDDTIEPCREGHVEHLGFDVEVRVPLAGDVVPPPADGGELLDRCVVSARRDGRDVTAAELPAAVVAEVEAALAAADPAAELLIELVCPDCAGAWVAPLDPVHFVWDHLDDWARRLADDVHVLASAFGWPEADILGLTPRRRRLYLDAVLG